MDWWNRQRNVQILVDHDNRILPWATRLESLVRCGGDACRLHRSPDAVTDGDILFLLGGTRQAGPDLLARSRRNLVVQESDLPAGPGFAPRTWQVPAGARPIPLCLMDASAPTEAARVFMCRAIDLTGTESGDELRAKQGDATVAICMDYLRAGAEPVAAPRRGEVAVDSPRPSGDSQLDVHGTLGEQFEVPGVCDDQGQPAFFEYGGQRFQLAIPAVPDGETGDPESAGHDGGLTDNRCFVVAGCKSWNRELFHRHAPNLPGRWHFLQEPEELSRQRLQQLKPDMLFFLHWSWRVEPAIFEQYPCVCFHMTDVPYGRGGSPLQNLIQRGHRETVLTALQMTGELDAGPVYLKQPLSLQGTAAEILRRATNQSFGMIGQLVRELPLPRPQQGQPVVFERREPADSVLPEDRTIADLHDHIRMLDGEGYPPAFLDWGHYRLEFAQPRLAGDGKTLRATVTLRARPSVDPWRKAS